MEPVTDDNRRDFAIRKTKVGTVARLRPALLVARPDTTERCLRHRLHEGRICKSFA